MILNNLVIFHYIWRPPLAVALTFNHQPSKVWDFHKYPPLGLSPTDIFHELTFFNLWYEQDIWNSENFSKIQSSQWSKSITAVFTSCSPGLEVRTEVSIEIIDTCPDSSDSPCMMSSNHNIWSYLLTIQTNILHNAHYHEPRMSWKQSFVFSMLRWVLNLKLSGRVGVSPTNILQNSS